MGAVYLIGEAGNDGVYKIGRTSAGPAGRMKQLQTGNPEELYVREAFETKTPVRLEQMLHQRFANSNLMNEWFSLTEDEVGSFLQTCKKLQDCIDSLRDNPFYKAY